MLALDQMKAELVAQQDTLTEVTASMDIENRKKKIEELSREMEEPDFWENAEKANQKTIEMKGLQDVVSKVEQLNASYRDILELIDMGNEEGTEDPELAAEIRTDLDTFTNTLEDVRISNLLNGEYDRCNAILKLSAGAGGTESCDFAQKIGRAHV